MGSPPMSRTTLLRALAALAALTLACSEAAPTASSSATASSPKIAVLKMTADIPDPASTEEVEGFEPCEQLSNFYDDQEQRRAEYRARPSPFVPAEASATRTPSGLELMGVKLAPYAEAEVQLQHAQLEVYRKVPPDREAFGQGVLRSVLPAAGVKAVVDFDRISQSVHLALFALRDPPSKIAGQLETTLFRAAQEWACSGVENKYHRPQWRAIKLPAASPVWELAASEYHGCTGSEQPAVWVSLVPAQSGSLVTACVSYLHTKAECAKLGLALPKSELDPKWGFRTR